MLCSCRMATARSSTMFFSLCAPLYLLCSSPDPEKTRDGFMEYTMDVQTRIVFPVVQREPLSSSVPHLLSKITGESMMGPPPYYDDITACHVRDVHHYRSDQHELVVVHYIFTADGKTDHRYARFERFRSDEGRLTGPSKLSSVDQLLSNLSAAVRLDSVKISNSLDTLILGKRSPYELVQTLVNVTPGMINILDVVVLADALGIFARDYSALSHMCMWYAAALFVLIRHRVRYNAHWRKGEAFQHGGTAKIRLATLRPRISLVNPETAQLVQHSNQKLEKGLQNLFEAVYVRGKLNQEQLDKLRATVKADLALFSDQAPNAVHVVELTVEDLLHRIRQQVRERSDMRILAESELKTLKERCKAAEDRAKAAEAAVQAMGSTPSSILAAHTITT